MKCTKIPRLKCADALSLDMCDSVILCMNSAAHVLVCTMLSHMFEPCCVVVAGLYSVCHPPTCPTHPAPPLPHLYLIQANLTDLFEYMDEEAMEKLYRLLVSRCHTGGRLAYWNLLCRRHCPSSLKDQVQPLSDLAASLHSKDRVFFYSSFQVDEILP